ncbi:MAG: glycosyltransferase 87 family protein [Arachnia sp.]
MHAGLGRLLSSRLFRGGSLALFVVSVAILALGHPASFPTPYRIDLDVYRTGAQVFLDGGDLYGAIPALANGKELPFTYPPIAAALFTVFTPIPLWVGSLLLTCVSMCSVALTVFLMLRRVTEFKSGRLWWVVVAVLAIGLWFGPVRETLSFGQVNAILMLLIVLDALYGRGRWWGGMLIGLAIAIKLTPAVFLLLFVLRRDWRSALTTTASFLAFTGLGFLLMPDDSMQYWTSTLADTERIGGASYASNQSINAVLLRLGLEGSTRNVAWFAVALVVGLFIAWVAGRLLRYGHHTAATITVAFAALFCSPVSWGHHWVWGLPLVLLILAWAMRPEVRTLPWFFLAGSGGVVFLATPQWWFPGTRNAELMWTPLQQLVGSSYLVWALIALLSMGLAAHRLGRSDSDGAETSTVLFSKLFSRPRSRVDLEEAS